jgi:prephenate dehydrogenase
MKNITIIGAGLIGGSLGMALKKKFPQRYRVTALGRNPEKLKIAKNMKAADIVTVDTATGIKDADIVVICTPVDLIAATVKRILPFIKRGAVITDAGSVKGPVLKDIKKVFLSAKRYPLYANFVGAHPMAGSEKYGIKAAKAGLYEGATVVLTPENNTSRKALNEVITMWEDAGARLLRLKPAAHDKIVALVSHLPHIIAFNLCSALQTLSNANPSAPKLAAGSFSDLTRVASSNPRDWAVICGANKTELSRTIDSFIKELTAVKLSLNKQELLAKRFEKSKTARQKLSSLCSL